MKTVVLSFLSAILAMILGGVLAGAHYEILGGYPLVLLACYSLGLVAVGGTLRIVLDPDLK